MSDHDLLDLLIRFRHEETMSASEFANQLSFLKQANQNQFEFALEQLNSFVQDAKNTENTVRNQLATAIATRQLCFAPHVQTYLQTNENSDRISRLYRFVADTQNHAPQVDGSHLLAMLATTNTRSSLANFANLISELPPQDERKAVECFVPFFRQTDPVPEFLFPKIFDALVHSNVAGMLLDLANFWFRQGKVQTHPVMDSARPELVENLIRLLGQLAERLGVLEELAPHEAGNPEKAKQAADAINLAISLCDTMGLIRAEAAIPKLNQLLSLSHRRLRVEAAAALTRLRDEQGLTSLVEMASEPVVRLRVVAYAAELGVLDQVAEQYRSAESKAQAEMVVCLADASYFGMPPKLCELVEHRLLYWPGFDNQVDCYLFRFEYQFVDGEYTGFGIVGPLTHCLSVDMSGLSVDDIFALFAGWQAQHEEISIRAIDPANPDQATLVARFQRRLSDAGYHNISPELMGIFFGERCLVATANHDEPGTVVVEPDEIHWFPRNAAGNLLSPEDAFSIFQGRKMLDTFNSD